MVPKGSDTWVSRGVCLSLLYCSSDPDWAAVKEDKGLIRSPLEWTQGYP